MYLYNQHFVRYVHNKGATTADIFEKIDNSVSSTTKTGRHDIAEILLKVALNTKIQIQIHSFIIDRESDTLIRNSIESRVLVKNPDVYFVGCSCHMVHNAARKRGDSFSGSSGFDVENLVVDLYYSIVRAWVNCVWKTVW
jgi:hypothetical protein